MKKQKKKITVKKLKEKIVSLDQENNDAIVDDDVWSVVSAFYDANGVMAAQIHSYNDFIYVRSHQIIDSLKKTVIEEIVNGESKKYILELEGLIFKSPSFTEKDDTSHDLFPIEALQRNVTYASGMYIDVTVTTPSEESTFYEKIPLGMMPVMVKSDLCNMTGIQHNPELIAKHNEDFYDQGGYFVIAPKGDTGAVAQRRILVPQERAAPNKVYIFSNRKVNPKYKTYAEVRSVGSNVHTTTTTVGFLGTGPFGRISAVLPWIDATEIPLGVLFAALGVIKPSEIAKLVIGSDTEGEGKSILNILVPTLEYSYECSSTENALYFIGKKGRKFIKEESSGNEEDAEDDQNFEDEYEADEAKAAAEKAALEAADIATAERKSAIAYATHLLSTEFLPHVGSHLPQNQRGEEKAKYLGYMTLKLILVLLNRRKQESRDHYMNKLVLTTGVLLGQQFYGALRRLIMEITKNTRKALQNGNTVNISSWIKPSIITNAMQGAISGNNWSTGGPTAKGISQLYEQFNYAGGLANGRKITVPIAAEGGKVIEPRDLHGSHFGVICVTGDTMIVLADGVSMCRIDQLQERAVMTVNPDTLKMEPSGIHNSFTLTPKDLISVRDDCGRILKCTPDHPFLVRKNGKNIWRRAGDLKVGDGVITTATPVISLFDVSYISSIEKIDPEPVYDFTTISDNHSFISNGFVTHNCPAETPEGKKAGLVKNLAFMCYVTVGSDPIPIRILIEKILEKNRDESQGKTRVFLNGVPIGMTNLPLKIINILRSYRRTAKISSETSISYFANYEEIHILVDGGRLCRPLFIVEDGEMPFRVAEAEKLETGKMTWTQLLASGCVELIDKTEEESCFIAGYPSELESMDSIKLKKVTHCEIHPSLIYGIGGSVIPFSNHNQSPRICYQASMGKQAVGIPFSNYRNMMAGSFHTMMYIQTPIALTRSASIIKFDQMASSQNALTAIMPRAFNEEDSIEMNQDSIDRGFMVSFKWTCYYNEVREENSELFGIPTEESCDRFKGDPRHLTLEGFPKPGTTIEEGDMIIGKMIENAVETDTIKKTKKKKYTNVSVLYDHEWPAVVDKILTGTSGEGYKFIRVMLCQRREPIVGDKFSFMHGQKGTIGYKPRAIDLPFNSQGMTPDIIMNSLALPSRMTIAMLIEAWTGKAILSTSPLHNVKVSDVTEVKRRHDEDDDIDDIPDKKSKNDGPSKDFRNMFEHPKNKALIDATPFRKFDKNIIRVEMKKYGLEYGDEFMTDGVTGKRLRALVFFGIAPSQKLKHMVVDKIHARARGGRTTLMRQPHEGRAMGGGLRFGQLFTAKVNAKNFLYKRTTHLLVHVTVGNTFKFRELLLNISVLNSYRNIWMAPGKTRGYDEHVVVYQRQRNNPKSERILSRASLALLRGRKKVQRLNVCGLFRYEKA